MAPKTGLKSEFWGGPGNFRGELAKPPAGLLFATRKTGGGGALVRASPGSPVIDHAYAVLRPPLTTLASRYARRRPRHARRRLRPARVVDCPRPRGLGA
jgi:hypothetical protein